jgi:hypothetical protein
MDSRFFHLANIVSPSSRLIYGLLRDSADYVQSVAYLGFVKGGRTSFGPITSLNCDGKIFLKNVTSSCKKIHGQAKGGGRTTAP